MVVEKSRVLTVPRAMVDVAPTDVLEAAASHGIEGIVVKRLDSPYRAGERSPFWIKTPSVGVSSMSGGISAGQRWYSGARQVLRTCLVGAAA